MPVGRRPEIRTLIAAVVAAACLGPAVTAAPANTEVLDRRAGIGYVASSHGYAAWSRKVAPNRYRLMVRHRGKVRVASISPRRVPFDVSIGRDARRRVVAVYSRCRSEQDGPAVLPGELPAYPSFSRCTLRALDLRPGRQERRVQLGGGSGITSRYMPSISGRRIAYAAIRRVAGSERQDVFLQTIGSRATPRRLPGGTTAARTPENGPLAIAYDGRRVVYSWRTLEAPCSSDEDLLGETFELWVDDRRTTTHRLARRAGCPTDPGMALFSPAFDNGALLFLELQRDFSSALVSSMNLRSNAVRTTSGPATTIAIAPYGRRLLRIRRDGSRAILERVSTE